jgi:hypothetical protein
MMNQDLNQRKNPNSLHLNAETEPAILRIRNSVEDTLLVRMVPPKQEFAQVDYTGTMKSCFVHTNLKQNAAQLSGNFIHGSISFQKSHNKIVVSTAMHICSNNVHCLNFISGKRKRKLSRFQNVIQMNANYHFVSAHEMETLVQFLQNQLDRCHK